MLAVVEEHKANFTKARFIDRPMPAEQARIEPTRRGDDLGLGQGEFQFAPSETFGVEALHGGNSTQGLFYVWWPSELAAAKEAQGQVDCWPHKQQEGDAAVAWSPSMFGGESYLRRRSRASAPTASAAIDAGSGTSAKSS